MATRTTKKSTGKTTRKVSRKTTRKSTKKATAPAVDFSDSIDKIKSTTNKVNHQVLDTANEVASDLKTNGKKITDAAVTSAKAAINTITETVADATDTLKSTMTVENMVDTAKTINKYTLKTAEEIIDGAVENGEKWQGITHKAVKGSLKLAGKQQEIVFDTLETVKGQMIDGAKRFGKLFRSK